MPNEWTDTRWGWPIRARSWASRRKRSRIIGMAANSGFISFTASRFSGNCGWRASYTQAIPPAAK